MPTTQIIAKEGFGTLFVIIVLLVIAVSLELELLGAVVLLLGAGAAWVFRNGERIPSERDPLSFIAPIDGKVESIDSRGKEIEVVISNGIMDAHLLRSPVQGKVALAHFKGGLYGSFEDDYGYLGEQHSVTVGAVGLSLQPKFKATAIYRYGIQSFLGERIGFFYGGRVVIRLPQETELRIGVGDAVQGGSSVIGFARSEKQ